MKRSLWLLALGLLAALAVPLLLGGAEVLENLRGVDPAQPLLMITLMFVAWNLNALRLRLLLAGRAGRIGQRRMLGVVLATEFAVCITPAGTGGALTLLTLLARTGLRPAQAGGVIAADQLIDALFFVSALVGVALYILTSAIDVELGWLLGLPMLLMLSALSCFALVIRYYPVLLRSFGRVLRWLTIHRLTGFRLARRLLHFRNALLNTLRLPKPRLLLAFLLCCANWAARYSVLYLAITALGPQIDWALAFVVQTVSMLGGYLTFLPGGAGGAELTSSALLIPMIGAGTAAAAVLLWRLTSYHLTLLVGAPVFLTMVGRPFLEMLMRRRRRESV